MINLPNVKLITIVDDAFIPIHADEIDEDAIEPFEVVAVSESGLRELGDAGCEFVPDVDTVAQIAEKFTDPEVRKGEIYAAALLACRRVDERREMRAFVKLLQETFEVKVLTVRPEDPHEFRDGGIVLLDFYLAGMDEHRGRARAVEIAKKVQSMGGNRPLLVLMSSQPDVRDLKSEFREEVGLKTGAFAFVPKKDISEGWKLRAYLTSFDGAMPHAAVIDAYTDAVLESVDKARTALEELFRRLDLTDYTYIQNLALLNDGHPFGNYLSWLLAGHLTAQVFEKDGRGPQAAVDKIVFPRLLAAASTPSLDVAQLFHDTEFEGNVGRLKEHPRDVESSWLPLLRLGDVFLSTKTHDVLVVLSADCDLAFAPDQARKPDKKTPVMLVPGQKIELKLVATQPSGACTELLRHGDQIFQIVWDFKKYRTVALNKVRATLEEDDFNIEDRVRLRPLYALQLQQEFAAHTFRVGVPTAPPVLRAIDVDIWFKSKGIVIPGDGGRAADRDQGVEPFIAARFSEGGAAAYTLKGKQHLVPTMALVDMIRDALGEVTKRLETEAAEEGTPPKRRTQLRSEVQSIRGILNDEEKWHQVATSTHELPDPGAKSIQLSGLKSQWVVVTRDAPDWSAIGERPCAVVVING